MGGTGRDVTARNQGEANLRRLAAVVAGSNDAVIVQGLDGTVSAWNPGAEKMYGYSEAEALGMSFSELVPHELVDGTLRLIARVAGGEQVESAETRRVHRDGLVLEVWITLTLLVDDAGQPTAVATTERDVTARNRAEANLIGLAAVAEKANLAKSEFLSLMSHELRTPLNSVIGFAQILEMNLGDHPEQQNVRYIYEAGQHLLGLIDEVLDISRIETGNLNVSVEPVAVGSLISECLDLVAPLAAERNIEVVNRNGGDRHVSGDRQRLKQVLLNLLSNAIKFNHDDGSVTVGVEDHGHGWVRVTVTDTGPGITPENVKKLFEPFERLDADVSNVQGTGLGLALSKGLIEAMGGVIGVDSVPGRHSTFWFELAAGPADHAADERDVGDVDADPGSSTGGMLLYIEDNLTNIRLIEQLLKQRPQIRLLTALQGSLGIELARQHGPDLILLDVHLADLSGAVVLHRLLKDPRTADIPVVIVSADATDSQIQRFRQAGAHDYLTKPFDIHRLLAIVDEHFTPSGPDR